MTKLLFAFLITFLPFWLFAEEVIDTQRIEGYVKNYYKDYSSDKTWINIIATEEYKQGILTVNDNWSNDANDNIYQTFYLLGVLEYSYNDIGWLPTVAFYNSATCNLKFEKDFLINYIETPKAKRYEYFNQAIDCPEKTMDKQEEQPNAINPKLKLIKPNQSFGDTLRSIKPKNFRIRE